MDGWGEGAVLCHFNLNLENKYSTTCSALLEGAMIKVMSVGGL